MGFFDWSAPLIRHWGDRWTADDALTIGGWLRPAVAAGSHILDVGGGSGQLAVLLADALDCHVAVLDPTQELVRHVPDHPRVSSTIGVAEDMPYADSSFDALLSSDAFHHFRDQDAAVREFCRVVRPGGCVLLLELDPSALWMRVIRVAERLVGEPGSFHTVGGMCAFMAERGIEGTCEQITGPNYRFLGTVVKPKDVA